MSKIELIATATFGLESVVKREIEKLGYKVLYEGVETDEQEEICVNSHADYLQGFKFSKPIPIEELKNFLSPIQE